MVDLSHLFSFSDFSLIDFIFGKDNNKKKITEKTVCNKNKQKIEIKNSNLSIKKQLSEKETKLILKLEIKIDNFLYRKKVKSLIEKLKDNYKISCSANIPDLSIIIISSKQKKNKQYKLIYEPILKENIAFLPRKIYRNKKKIKFNFVNPKNEIFIEPKYKTENENGSFVNVLDLREIKENEYKNYEDFQILLKQFNLKKNVQNNKNEITEIKNNEKNKENEIDKLKKCFKGKSPYLIDKNEFNENNTNYITDNELFYSSEDLKAKKIKYRKSSISSLKKNYKNLSGINSILKERKSQRIKNPRKISFGDVQFSY